MITHIIKEVISSLNPIISSISDKDLVRYFNSLVYKGRLLIRFECISCSRTMISGNFHQPYQSKPGTKLAPKKKPPTELFVSG